MLAVDHVIVQRPDVEIDRVIAAARWCREQHPTEENFPVLTTHIHRRLDLSPPPGAEARKVADPQRG